MQPKMLAVAQQYASQKITETGLKLPELSTVKIKMYPSSCLTVHFVTIQKHLKNKRNDGTHMAGWMAQSALCLVNA